MNDKTYQNLINKKIDGMISVDEESALNGLLSENPEAQRYYRDMQATMQLLSDTPQIQPSENLKKHIMNSIDLNRYAAKPENVIPATRWWLMPKTGLAFAAGLLLGIVLYTLFLPGTSFISGPAENEMYGTIGMSNNGNFQTISEIPVKSAGTNGLVTLKNSENLYMLDVNLNPSDNVEIFVRFNESEIRFAGFKEQNNLTTLFDSGTNYVHITKSENTHCKLYFDKLVQNGAAVTFQVVSVSGEYFNKDLMLD